MNKNGMIYTFKDKKDIIDKRENSVYLFPFPIDCIRRVIVGCKMSNENRSYFLNLLNGHDKYRHIKVHQAMEDEKESKINISDYKASI